MERQSIDKAVLAQHARRDSLLRDVVRSGGVDGHFHLLSHGHHHATISCAIRDGHLIEVRHRRYKIAADASHVLSGVSE